MLVLLTSTNCSQAPSHLNSTPLTHPSTHLLLQCAASHSPPLPHLLLLSTGPPPPAHPAGPPTCCCCVQRDLPLTDAHAVGAQVPQPQDALAIRDHHHLGGQGKEAWGLMSKC